MGRPKDGHDKKGTDDDDDDHLRQKQVKRLEPTPTRTSGLGKLIRMRERSLKCNHETKADSGDDQTGAASRTGQFP